MPRALYIYWKTTQPGPAVEAARVAQQALCAAQPGLAADLLRREGAGGPAGLATLMEVYRLEGHAGGVDAALQSRIERTLEAATRGLRSGERHVEVFVEA